MLYISDRHGSSVRIYDKPNFVFIEHLREHVGQDKDTGADIYETRYRLKMFFDSGVVNLKSDDIATVEKIASLGEGEYKVLSVWAYSLGEDLCEHWPAY